MISSAIRKNKDPGARCPAIAQGAGRSNVQHRHHQQYVCLAAGLVARRGHQGLVEEGAQALSVCSNRNAPSANSGAPYLIHSSLKVTWDDGEKKYRSAPFSPPRSKIERHYSRIKGESPRRQIGMTFPHIFAAEYPLMNGKIRSHVHPHR